MIKFHRSLFNTNNSLCNVQEMYFRTNLNTLNYNNNITLGQGDFFSTDTYFNSLSISKIKKYTIIEDVHLSLKVKGKFFLKIYHINDSLHKTEIFSKQYVFNELAELNIELEQWSSLSGGLLYFVIHAIDITSLYDFSYLTNTKPTQDVDLAIVITHFNRQQYLLPALERIQDDLLNDSDFSNISVIVSDNSQNLKFYCSDKIKIYKNMNFGGSGGFTFGLLKAKESGFTHCLFMDDDASTEIESIKRTYNLLGFMKNPDIAILGAMLFKEQNHIQHENGSKCKSGFKAIHNKLDLSVSSNLIKNDEEFEIEFGGWWFFCFKINSIKYLPFPFFVRGDDVTFSLANKLEICTFNGIASWQEDFRSKHNSYLEYLNIRSSFVMNLIKQFDYGYLGFFKLYLKTFLGGILTHRYNSCIAASMALNDILKGEEFWNQNIDMVEKRKVINEKFVYEKIIEASENYELKTTYKLVKNEKIWKKMFRIFTWNGIFFPSFFLKKEPLRILYYTPSLIDTFGYKKVHYYNNEKIIYIECERNIKTLIRLIFLMFLDLLKITFFIPFFYNKYKKIYFNLTREEYWRKVLGM